MATIRNDSEYIRLTLHAYDNPSLVSLEDFEEDLARVSTIIGLWKRYKKDTEKFASLRLILNHYIVLNNVFGSSLLSDMLDYKIPSEHKMQSNTVMMFLNLTESIDEHGMDFELLLKLQSV